MTVAFDHSISADTMFKELANGLVRYIVILVSTKSEFLITPVPVDLSDAITIFKIVDLSAFEYTPGKSKLQLRRFENTEAWDILDSYLYTFQPRNMDNPDFQKDRDQVTDEFLLELYQKAIKGPLMLEMVL